MAFTVNRFVGYLESSVLTKQMRLRKVTGITKIHLAYMLLRRDTDLSFPSPMVRVFYHSSMGMKNP